ncbi:MAG: hypothetical protein WCJ92_07290 [Alphaproteobacteria bacterium]
MVDVILVLGATGIVGRQLHDQLLKNSKPIIAVSAAELARLDSCDFDSRVSDIISEINTIAANPAKIGIVLAHRIRNLDSKNAVVCELKISKDFIWKLSGKFKFINVVVLGSVAGKLVDMKTPDAYHLSKDVQKTCARLSLKLTNVAMNVLELGWFEKYPEDCWSAEYRKNMLSIKQHIGPYGLPSLVDLAKFVLLLLDLDIPPRGQTITYDGGYSLLQH